VKRKVFLLFVTDNTAMNPHKTGLMLCFTAAVGDMAEDASNPIRVWTQLPVQVFLMVALG
jgi:hypothetical protein